MPFIERMVKVDLRTVTMDVPAQEVITRDNVTVRVNAVAYFKVLDPNAAGSASRVVVGQAPPALTRVSVGSHINLTVAGQ